MRLKIKKEVIGVEEWRVIEGYENYAISNYGNVKNIKTNYQLKTRVNSYTGYVQIGVRKDGKAKTFNVHRLVALAFIQNPTNLPEVNHRDEDKTNNQVSNLEWCDREYNANYGTRNERVRKSKQENPRQYTEEERKAISERTSGEKHWNYGGKWDEETKRKNMLSQKSRKPVRCVETGIVYDSIKQATKALGLKDSAIHDALTGRNRVKRAGGYHWEVV